MRADNRGEGGTFALWALLKGYTGRIVGISVIGYLVVAAAGLLAADGVITPPISLLGAYEPLGERWAVAATLVSLFVLFKAAVAGHEQGGRPLRLVHDARLVPVDRAEGPPLGRPASRGVPGVRPDRTPSRFLAQFPRLGAFVILGVVVLAITGGEAKYADIGHFARKGETEAGQGQSLDPKDSGRRPVMFSWFYLVLPCLLCNYAGQVAYMLERGVPPRANTFYALTPRTGDPTADARHPRRRPGRLGHRGVHRLAGADHGDVLDRQAGDRAGVLPAVRGEVHQPRGGGPGLHPGASTGRCSSAA